MDRRQGLATRFAALASAERRELEQKLAAEGIDVWALPIPRADAREHPLAPAQERLLLAQELEPERALHQQCFALALRGPLDLRALEAAWAALSERHAALRTRLARTAEGVVQRVEAAGPALAVSDAPDAAQRAERLQRAVHERLDPFAGIPAALDVLRAAPGEHVLLLRLHHLLSDAWSLGIVARELAALYRAERRGEPAPLAPLPIEYGDFARWQRRWLDSAAAERQLESWTARLAGAGPAAAPHADLAPVPGTARRGRIAERALAPERVRALRALAQREGTTLYTALLAVLQALLARFAGTRDVCIGSSVAHRPRPETDPLVGCFINTLALRTSLAGAPSGRELLARARATTRAALAEQDLPFERIQAALARERAGAGPLFRVFFALLNAPFERVALDELEVAPIPLGATRPTFDLALRASGTAAGGLALALELDATLYARRTGEQLLAHFEALLGELVAEPDAPVATWSGSDARERAELLEVRQPAALPSDPPLLLEALARRAALDPTRVAVRDSSGASLDRATLLARARQLAASMIQLGVAPGDVVALESLRSVHWLVGALAAWIAGAHYLPLDPELPPERRRSILTDAAPRALLRAGVHAPFDGPALDIGDVDPGAPLAPLPALCPSAPAYRLYTSGSSGEPKPVAVSHAQLAHYAAAISQRLGLAQDHVCAAVSSLAADLALTSVAGALAAGACVWLIDADHALAPDRLADLFQRAGAPHVAKLTPSLLRLWLAHSEPQRLLPSHLLVLGGQALDSDLVRSVHALAPTLRVVNHYGPTESTVGVLTHEIPLDAPLPPGQPIPLGRPLDHARAYVLDSSGSLLPDGVPGELAIGGLSVSLGYPGRPADTALRFRPDPFSPAPGARLYTSGDRVRFDPDGHLLFLGRLDAQISIRGLRIEPAEIESALRSLPQIRDAAVLPLPPSPGADPQLVAFVASASDSPDAWRAALRSTLPEPFLPTRFVRLDQLPRSPNLKLDRRALELLLAPPAAPFAAPASPLERTLVDLWQQVLRRSPIGVNDDFFALGGDSILALQILARARRQGLAFAPRDLFDLPSIRALAPRVQRAPAPTLESGAPDGEAYALSPLQRGILFHALDAPESGVYVNQLSGALPAELDRAALRRALGALAERHTILRTSFEWESGEPRQRVAPHVEIPLLEDDWGVQGGEELAARWEGLLAEDLARGFALDRAPLMRLRLVRAGGELRFVWTRHHLLLDGWSSARLLRELAELYAAAAAHEPLPPLPPALPYRRFIDWLGQRDAAADAAFWRAALAGIEEPTRVAEPRAARPDWHSAARSLGSELSQRLRAFARAARLTPNSVLQGSWAILLARRTRRRDVAFGATVAGRPAELEGIERALGLFINTVPVRAVLRPEQPVAAWLAELQSWNARMREHEHAPLAEIQRLAGLPAGEALFDTLFVYESYPVPRGGAGLALAGARHIDRTSYPLALVVGPQGGDLALELSWDAERLRDAEPERWLARLAALVEAIVASPATPLGALPGAPSEERARIAGWNRTAAPQPELPVHRQIEQRAAEQPNTVAVIQDGGAALARGELERRASQLAHVLIERGVRREDRVALCLERSPELVVAILAVLKAGAAWLPLEPGAPRAHVARILATARPALALVHAATRSALAAPELPVLCLDAEAERLGSAPARTPDVPCAPDQLAYVIYTSGSTGEPKGAALTHGGLANRLRWMQAAHTLAEDDRVLHKTPYTFDVSVWELLWPLAEGAALVLAAPGGQRDPAYLTRALAEHAITTVHFVPSLLRAWLEEPDVERASALRRVIASGEVLPAELAARCRARLRTPLHNLYGPTEASIDVTAHECRPDDREPLPIGRPIANTWIRVLDTALQPTGIDAPGELCIGGAPLARGYLGAARRTAQAFVPDPESRVPGARLYRTGDLARWRPDGELDFLGRLDAQLKLRGQRIEPGEIEAALLEHPDVREVAVRLRTDAPGGARLVAYVAPRGGRAPPPAELRDHLAQRIPAPRIPAQWVELAALPRTASGKLDARALPAPAPPSSDADGGAPASEAERRLAAVWRDVLGAAQVRRGDSFFALGGDSILCLQVVARARRAGLALAPRDVFDHPTLAELARAARPAAAPVGADEPVGPLPLTPIQRWFFAQELPERAHWNQALLLEVPPGLDRAALRRAWDAVGAAHDAFALSFFSTPDGVVQQSGAGVERPPLDALDGRAWPAAERRARIERAAGAAQRSLDLSRGPLARALHIDLGPEQPGRLLLVAHHLAIDGVSWRILLDDLALAFEQAAAGREPQVPAPPTPFARFARALAEHARAPRIAAQRPYWEAQLAACGAPLPGSGGDGRVASARTRRVALGAQATRALLERVHAAYRTQVDDLVLAALAPVLGAWCGVDAVAVELEGHGRDVLGAELDLSRTVGWLTTRYPALLPCLPAAERGERLCAVKEALRAIPERGAGFGLLRYLDPAGLPGPAPAISYNNLGQLDRAQPSQLPVRRAAESAGDARAPAGRRAQPLEITAFVLDGELQLAWSYDGSLHREATIAALAQDALRELEALIEHCLTRGAGGLTPSDVPLAGLARDELLALFGSAADIEDVYPVSPTQAGILFHSAYAPTSRAYSERLDFAVAGPLDAGAFEAAWRDTAARHPALRTAFRLDAPRGPLQVVYRASACQLELVREDWRGREPSAREAALAERIAADHARGFELGAPGLLRLQLIQLEDERHAVLASHHHAVTDGWSVALLLEEVLERYRAARERRPPELRPAPPYRRCLEWRAALADRDPAYWRECLRGFARATPLPGPAETARPAYVEHVCLLPEPLSARLRALARERDLTLGSLFQGAFALLLARASGERDVVYGLTGAGRPPELEGADRIVGPFIQTLPVRALVEPAAPRAAWLRRLQRESAAQREHESSALAEIQLASELPAGEPLFRALLVFENYPVAETLRRAAPGPLRIEPLPLAAQQKSRALAAERNHYPLTLAVQPGARIACSFAHDRSAIGTHAVRGLARQLEALLGELVAEPDAPVATWSGSDARERAELLHTRQPAALPRDPPLLLDALAQSAEREPSREAGRDASGASLDRATLLARARQLAASLIQRGVTSGDVVAIESLRSVHWLVGVLATWIAAAHYLPLEPELPPERRRRILADAAPRFLLRSGVHAPFDGPALDIGDIEPGAPLAPLPTLCPNAPAYRLYTSGSSGEPKPVAVSHAQLAHYAAAISQRLGLAQDHVCAAVSSLAADLALTSVAGALAAGACVWLIDADHALAPDRLADLFQRAGAPHVAKLTPSLLRLWLAHSEPQRLLPSHLVVLGGQALDSDLVRSLRALAPTLRVVNHYGPTESTVGVLTHEIPLDAPLPPGQPIPLGRPLDHARAYVLDSSGSLLPDGVPGELAIGGLSVSLGYPGRPADTALRFRPDPFSPAPGARLYTSGDRVRFDPDGHLLFLGRLDAQISIRGLRIEPAEIESALRSLPQIRDAAVLPLPPSPGADPQLVAFVASASDSPDAWRAALRSTLPEPFLPTRFVRLDQLPRSPNLKLDRRALELLLAPPAAPFAAPASPLERTLVDLWQQVLRRSPIGVNDDFFALGGDSILALQILARARRQGLAFAPRDLFDLPSIRALAPRVQSVGSAPQVPVEVVGPVPLLPIQRAFFALDPAERQHWNQSAFLEIPAGIEPAALRGAFAALVARHAALRQRFRCEGGVWRAELVAPDADAPPFFEARDVSALAAEPQRVALEAACAAAQRSLDLERGPLLRVLHMMRAREASARLLIVLHHLVVDAVSWRILMDEVAALLGSEAAEVSVPPLSAADWARQLEVWGRDGTFDAELPYWLERPAFALPCDGLGPNLQGDAAHVDVALAADVSAALLEELPGLQRTRADDVVLGALGAALARFAGSDTVVIECEGHGRRGPDAALDLSRTFGWLTARYPLVLRGVGAAGDPVAALRRVKRQLRAVPNGGLGYGVLRHLSAHAEQLAALPEPQVCYNNLGQPERGGPTLLGVAPAPEASGPTRSPRGRRAALLDVTAHVAGGRLQLRFTYGARLHRARTIEALAAETEHTIQAWVAAARAAGAETWVPEDLPDAALDEAGLAELLAEMGDG